MNVINKITRYLLSQNNIIYNSNSKSTNSIYFDIANTTQSIRISDHVGKVEEDVLSIIVTSNNDGYIIMYGFESVLYLKTWEQLRTFIRGFIFICSEDKKVNSTVTVANSVNNVIDMSKLSEKQQTALIKMYNSYIAQP